MPDKTNTKLTEGYTYPFIISGKVTLPDGSEQIILKDPNGVKHLLDAEPYKNYGFRNKQTIRCHIDKINCTGRIFIEPEHPHYTVGEKYNFKLAGFKSDPEKRLELAVFLDIFGYESYIPNHLIPEDILPGDSLQCTVERIKRARIFIVNQAIQEDFSGMETGRKYSFRLSRELFLGDQYDFYLITDSAGREFKLRKKYYNKYGFNEGDEIFCTLYMEGGQFFLEPDHPLYTPGKIYKFNISHKGFIYEYPDIRKEAFYLYHSYGKEMVLKTEDVLPWKIHKNEIECKVESIRYSIVTLKAK
ncbi:MAG: hypothetical protein K9H49_02115 [Bacteroidales bacterium]|nr:hypothetical protein [Bacteroidales bacterium]MCF8403364.1 hypothetical protein [Bacteroidales bacterium]